MLMINGHGLGAIDLTSTKIDIIYLSGVKKNNMQVQLYKRKTPLSRDISCACGVFQLLDKSSLVPKTIQSCP
jgi:hypothetical protein